MQPYSLIAPASTPQLMVIVAEPDNATRTHLRRALNKDHSIKKVIECSNGQKALAAIDQHQPHILFIETHLPDMSGFDVLERNPQIPSVIFLSSFEGSAVRAFDMNAVDFLLKPFLDKRLTKAIRRAKWIATIEETKPPKYLHRLNVHKNDGTSVLKLDDVDFFISASNYVTAHHDQESYQIRCRMSDLARNLHPKQFIRIHRSFIVNLEAITKIRHHPRYGYQVELRGGRQLQIGTKYLDRIRAAGILEIEDRSRSKVN